MPPSPSAPDSTAPPVAAPADRATGTDSLPMKVRLAYGFGGMADRIGNQGIKDLGNPIYNLILGINPAIIGLVFVVTRLFDAFIDPLFGSWSDNARTRWGRRKPFIVIGGILSAVTIVPVFWIPTGLGDEAKFLWMLGTAVVFFTAFTAFDVPYRAFAYELAPAYHQKTQLLGTRTIFMTLSSLASFWVFPFAQLDIFDKPQDAIPWIAAGLGVLILISAVVPALCTKPEDMAVVHTQRRIALGESLKHSLRCRPFLLLIGMGAMTIAGVNIGFGFGSYITIYYSFAGDAKAAGAVLGATGTATVLAVLLAVPLTTAISRRIGKRETLLWSLGWAMCGSIGSWWFYSPGQPWLQLVFPFFFAPGTVGLWMFGESMVGDVCEVESLRTGERCEAMFSAVFGWILKCATAVAVLVSNLLLNATGFDVANGTNQSLETVTQMRLLYAAFPTIGFIGSILFLWRYPLNAARMADVRRSLDVRQKRARAE